MPATVAQALVSGRITIDVSTNRWGPIQLWRLPQAKLFRTLKVMEVQLTPDQKAFVRQAIQSGRLHREEDAVQEALALWEERERTRAEILVAVDEAEASVARGEGRVITRQSMRDLTGEVKQRGRDRLASEQPPDR
jgi:Arc/MetJ-type ribon-helix-helix transcriptional regulator